MQTLFKNIADDSFRPLAYRMRPEKLEDFVGQEHIVGNQGQLRSSIESGRFFSVILYGPAGCGKSAIANIIYHALNARVERINAVNSSVKDLREIIERAKHYLAEGKKTVLIIDEIHRFSRNQQEALLPDVEEGTIVLVGLTTESPFYTVIGPQLSRAGVYRLNPLSSEEIKTILNNAVTSKRGLLSESISLDSEAADYLAGISEGDARYALNILEQAAYAAGSKNTVDMELIKQCTGEKRQLYDRKGTQHYDAISAFIKSMRGSDPNATVFYLAKMLTSGEDPRFIARRIAICASEDVGNADPQALILANAALGAVEYVGMPEARIILAQAALYIATAPKSNASYQAIDEAMGFIQNSSIGSVPEHLTKAGAKNYKYPHNYEYGYVKQNYSPVKKKFYFPVKRGYEKSIIKYLEFIEKLNGKN